MKKLLLFLASNVFSQKETNFWYFDKSAGLDFSSETPFALANEILSTNEGSVIIYNKKGKLLSSDNYLFNVQIIPTDKSKPSILKEEYFSLLRK